MASAPLAGLHTHGPDPRAATLKAAAHVLRPHCLRNAQEVPFDLVQVDLSKKPGWYRSVNPRGLVPAVAWRGQTVVESVDIVRRARAGGRACTRSHGSDSGRARPGLAHLACRAPRVRVLSPAICPAGLHLLN